MYLCMSRKCLLILPPHSNLQSFVLCVATAYKFHFKFICKFLYDNYTLLFRKTLNQYQGCLRSLNCRKKYNYVTSVDIKRNFFRNKQCKIVRKLIYIKRMHIEKSHVRLEDGGPLPSSIISRHLIRGGEGWWSKNFKNLLTLLMDPPLWLKLSVTL